MNLRFTTSGHTLVLPGERVVVDAERGHIDLNQRSVWWNCYQYEGTDPEGTHLVGAFIQTVHNDGHQSRRSRT